MKYVDVPRHQLELLTAFLLHKDRIWVLTHRDYGLSDEQQQSLARFYSQLMSDVPLSYIVGYKRFYDVDFLVNHHVLIPRQETEELVQRISDQYKHFTSELIFVDVGTGSGCIGLSLARLLPTSQFILIDTSSHALEIAQKNHQIQSSPSNVKFFQGDLIEPLVAGAIYPQVIVANLPYISETLYPELPTGVVRYEPRLALDGGFDGLVLYRKLLVQMVNHYHGKPYPDLWWEISPEQRNLIPALFTQFSNAQIEYIQDLNERDRFVHVTFS